MCAETRLEISVDPGRSAPGSLPTNLRAAAQDYPQKNEEPPMNGGSSRVEGRMVFPRPVNACLEGEALLLTCRETCDRWIREPRHHTGCYSILDRGGE